ncbi:MAG: hypothetical protein ACI4XP_08745 [Acutalibacteraceae bacterium]
MKKIIPFVICAAMALALTGCATQSGPQLESVQASVTESNTSSQDSDTSKTDDTSKETSTAKEINADDYDNNLKGLEKYFVDMGYIPEKSKPTKMMYGVIGAIDGDRYNFVVNSTAIYLELYEYNPDDLKDEKSENYKEGNRVINEVKKDGKFYVFDNNGGDNVAYEATLSDNGKYLMIYTDNSTDAGNVQRKADVKNALKEFHK